MKKQIIVDRNDRCRWPLSTTRLHDLHRMSSGIGSHHRRRRQVEKRVMDREWVDDCIEVGRILIPEGRHRVRLSYDVKEES